MSKSLKLAIVTSVFLTGTVTANAGTFGLGRTATTDEIAAWDRDIRPDGLGLPPGRGDVLTGEEVFAETCAICHGDFGEGVDRWPVLAGGQDTLTDERPVKTIGSFWPYLSTVFDYVYRAMPFGNAQTLEPDQVYAITAYLLYSNDLVDEDFELNSDNFTDVRLPNEANFYMDDRADVELAAFSAPVCMEDCKTSVEITSRAAGVDVTPDRGEKEVEVVVVEPEPQVEQLDPELVAAGEKLFRKCKSCHQIGEGAKNKTGPALNGVVGRIAGSADGYRYSKAFIAANADGLIWNDETLAEYLTKPRAFIKGTKMSFVGLKKEKDLNAITAYLKSKPN